MQNTEKQRIKEKYIIVRMTIHDGQYSINSSYPPTRMHNSHFDATIEAERLAKAFPGSSFAIFKLDSIGSVPLSPIQWINL